MKQRSQCPWQEATPYQLTFADNADTPAITERSAPWNQKKLMKRQHHPLHSITVIWKFHILNLEDRININPV